MLKAPLSLILCSCAVFGSVMAHAAEEQRYTIELKATIPTEAFQVIPVEAGWIGQPQEMEYDLGTDKLLDFSKEFQYKNTSGAIQATLLNTESSGLAILSNGTDDIPLTVSFNHIPLTKEPVTVVDVEQAKMGGRTQLIIAQKSPDALELTGSFTGSVVMMFEPQVTPPEKTNLN